MAETNTEADVSFPVAEWLSIIRTPSPMSSSRKACLLFDLYLHRGVFHRVSFELKYRSADAETVEKRPLFNVSNDANAVRIKDMFEISLSDAVSRYQVIILLSQAIKVNISLYRCRVPLTVEAG